MFSQLDTNFDLQLDQSEIKSLYLDRNEPCSDTFFKSCDIHADKVISSSEWCTCFHRYTGMSFPNRRFPFQILHATVLVLDIKREKTIFSVHAQNSYDILYREESSPLYCILRCIEVWWIKLILDSLLVIKKVHCSINTDGTIPSLLFQIPLVK